MTCMTPHPVWVASIEPAYVDSDRAIASPDCNIRNETDDSVSHDSYTSRCALFRQAQFLKSRRSRGVQSSSRSMSRLV